MSNRDGVHASHCCVVHGCKYGEDDCPVVNRSIEQEYLCEGCSDDGLKKDDIKAYFNKIELIESFYSDSARIESGPVKPVGDWTGVFIRGDNANYYALLLDQILEQTQSDDVITITQLKNLSKLLKSSLQ